MFGDVRFYPYKKWLRKKGELLKLCSGFCFLRRREVGFLHKDVKSWFEMGTTNKIATTSSYLSCSNDSQNKQKKVTTSKQIPTITHKINSQLQDLAKFYKPRNSRNKPDPQMYKAKRKKAPH